jgi:hypothetical protein
MLFTECVQQVRVMLGDDEAVDDFGEIVPPQYPDDRLSALLAISIRQVQTQLRIPQGCRLEPLLEMPYIDPWYDINDDFAYLVILKALCNLQKREIENQFGLGHVTAALGPAKIATGAAPWGSMPKHIWEHTSPCAEYNKEIMTWVTFDPRKLHAVYSILPDRGGEVVRDGRSQSDGDMTQVTMVQ